METTLTSGNATISRVTSSELSAYEKFIKKLDFSYFGLISMTILIGSIVSGISAMFILQNDAPIWQLGICMALGMANNVGAIGQAPTKWIVNIFLGCILVNSLLIFINL